MKERITEGCSCRVGCLGLPVERDCVNIGMGAGKDEFGGRGVVLFVWNTRFMLAF